LTYDFMAGLRILAPFILVQLALASSVTVRPAIGVLAVPADISCDSLVENGGGGSCFSTVYASWLEASGARVFGIPYNSPKPILDEFLSSLNGILFTGGSLDLSAQGTSAAVYLDTANYLYNGVLAANDKGIHLPLHGTCMGFQLLNILTSKNQSVLSLNAFDSEDLSIPLNMTSEAAESRLFGPAQPANIMDNLRTQPITSNLHHDGVTPADFNDQAALTSFYRVLSTNMDRKGKEFVSTIEGKDYPITATQWHPERPQFEFDAYLAINHSLTAVESMQWLSNYFVGEAMQNSQEFQDVNFANNYSTYGFSRHVVGDLLNGYQMFMFP